MNGRWTSPLLDWERQFLARKYDRLIRMGEQAKKLNLESKND